MPRWWLAVVAAALAIGGVLTPTSITGREPPTPDPSIAAPATTARSDPTPTRAAVPNLVGLRPGEARSVLRDAGLEMLVNRVPGRRCDTTRRVLKQSHPTGHRQPVQAWVRVDALSCGLTAQLREVAEHFIAFARRDLDLVPADMPVDLYVGGRIATTIDTLDLDDPDAWRGCPSGLVGWAGRTCPFSAVDPINELKSVHGEPQITAAAPDLPCGPVQRLPRALGASRRVAISGGTSCVDSFAITLFINDVARIVAADIAWSEP